ncbi:hypothetical protein [Heliomarina baculiformis]|uniref:hypothetical protein n=1 Tax=Heliomarina baculiformis TaxID=2872036 RepID=UPI001EE1B43A|nr:hypothetical protein [Heliomarina baculiformis]
MPELVKLYMRHTAIGFAIAGGFVALLLGFDVQSLRSLIFGSQDGMLALFLLWFMNGIVFAGVQFAWAVMSMSENNEPRGGMRLRLRRDEVAIPVRVEDKRRPF